MRRLSPPIVKADARVRWVSDVLSGRDSADAANRLASAMRTWIKGGGHSLLDPSGRRARRPSLARCAGLPDSPERVRMMVRDVFLKDAAELAAPEASTLWACARALHEEARIFMRTKWPCWCDFDRPPAHATPLQAALWHAAAAGGGDLPGTAERMAQILKS